MGEQRLMHGFMGAMYHIDAHYATTLHMSIAWFLLLFGWVSAAFRADIPC